MRDARVVNDKVRLFAKLGAALIDANNQPWAYVGRACGYDAERTKQLYEVVAARTEASGQSKLEGTIAETAATQDVIATAEVVEPPASFPQAIPPAFPSTTRESRPRMRPAHPGHRAVFLRVPTPGA